jgi:hypothetical protein
MTLFLLSFFDFHVAAAPTVSESISTAVQVVSIPSSQNGNICGRRLMFSIVWGCLSTIFLCAWVSVHPNIPKPHRLEGIYRRFQLLFWMLVAPELVLVLSMRQWVAAGRIADIYNNTKLKASSPSRKRSSRVKTFFSKYTKGADLKLLSPNMDKNTWPFHYHGRVDTRQPCIGGERRW